MTDVVLEFTDVFVENMGHLNPGKIKFSGQTVIFKNTKTGKLDQIPVSQIQACKWVKLGNKPALKVVDKEGTVHRYGGFTPDDYDRMKAFTKNNWDLDLIPQEPSVKGWNYGSAEFHGPNLEFEVGGQESFEIPLSNVSNCTAGKNETILEFHQNEENPVALVEMRFHIPMDNPATPEEEVLDTVEEFRLNVLKYAASVTEESDDRAALVTLEKIFCSTPRGRYDIKIFPSHLSLHGKTFDYKIPVKTILRLFLLPHKDGNRMYFVVSLDPPIRQGQTRYHYLVLEFTKDEEVDVEMGLSQEQLDEKFGGKLQKTMSGPVYEVLSRIMRALCNQRITVPGGFVGHSGTPAVNCAFKQAAGFLYPLEKGFIYVHKPPMYIRFEDISCVNFARSDVSTRSFDFEVELKTETVYLFNSIEKDEYTRLYDFVEKKKLRIRNAGKRLDKVSYKEDDFAGSSDEEEIDPYKEKLKKEARDRQEQEAHEEESDSEDDSDYSPEAEEKKKVAAKKQESDATSGSEPDEEFDSDAGKSSGDSGGADSDASPKKKKKRPETPKKRKTEGGKKKKGDRDPNQPKKGLSAYFIWMGAKRSSIKEEGMSVADVAKKAGALWKAMGPDEKKKWEKKAAEDKERYEREMKEYRKTGGPSTSSSSGRAPPKKKKESGAGGASKKAIPTGGFKSKEYITDSDDGSDESEQEDKNKKKKEESGSGESGSGSGSGSGSESD